MAALIWTEPALQDLDAIADYIALDSPPAARELVRRVFQHVEQLQSHPESGSVPSELRRSSRRYRQIVEPPCRVFYRYDRRRQNILILHVIRGEMRLRKRRLRKRP
jgi:toxin ParE1/3/4